MDSRRPKIIRQIQDLFLPLMLAAVVGGMGGPMMIFPSSRLAELNEQLPAKERGEEASAPGRFDPQRHLRLSQHAVGAVFILLTWPQLGHSQHTVADVSNGHRLPNGLLAPLTC